MTRAPQRAALGAVLGVVFLTFLDTTIVSVTLGDLETDVGAGVISLQWVINAYALSFASLMLVGGWLGDRFGRRRLMVIGVVVFCAGSLVCALSDNATAIVIGRAVMGAGAAASSRAPSRCCASSIPTAASAREHSARGLRCPGSRSRSGR